MAYEGADTAKMSDAAFEAMSGLTIPALPLKFPVTLESRFTDLQQTFLGRILFNAVLGVAENQRKAALKLPEGTERDNKLKGALFLRRVLESNSVRSMSMSAARAYRTISLRALWTWPTGTFSEELNASARQSRCRSCPKR